MSLHVTLYLLGLVVAGLLCGGVGLYAWRHRERRDATFLAGLMGSALTWTVTSGGIVLFSATPPATLLGKLQYVPIALTVMFFFLLSLQYTGRERFVDRRTITLLFGHPVSMAVIPWTPGIRQQFLTYGARAPELFVGHEYSIGPIYYAHTIYSYALLAAGAALFVSFALRSDHLYRQQVQAILAGTFVPWIGNAVYLATPLNLDLTPIGFAVTGTALWWAIFSQDLLAILPVARSTVVENIGAGVFVLDRNNHIVDINDAGRELFDLGDQDIVGQDVTEILDPYPAVRDQFEGVADVTEEVDTEAQFGEYYYRVQVSPLHDKRDTLIGRLFLISDITEQKRRQRDLERQNQQLEQFASVVSHDLRNPLNVASGKLELGKMEAEGGQKHLEDVDRALSRMDEIIDDVLTLAREGQGIEERERVALGTVTRQAWQNVEAPAATFTVDGDRELEADADRLQRAFENLFRNAVEHGRSDVTITVGATADGFFVADDGPGIPEKDRDDVFENGFTTSEEGTGFGLAIVESIVEAHGWSISLGDSDEGARFDVTDVPPLADREPPDKQSQPGDKPEAVPEKID